MPHVCRRGATDHMLTNERCPLHLKDDDTFFGKILRLNDIRAKRKRCKQSLNASQNDADDAQKRQAYSFSRQH